MVRVTPYRRVSPDPDPNQAPGPGVVTSPRRGEAKRSVREAKAAELRAGAVDLESVACLGE